MVEQQEKIRITAGTSEVMVAIEGGVTDLAFSAGLPFNGLDELMPMDLSMLKPGDRPDEYVITLEFGPSEEGGETDSTASRLGRPGRLSRLDAHLRNVSLRLRDDGYILEGDLVGWVGYTRGHTTVRRGKEHGGGD